MLRSKFYNSETRNYEMQTRYVGRSLYAAEKTVQVMSDIWEQHLVLHSVAEDGHIVENSVAGWSGEKPEWSVDATEEAFEAHRAYREEYHYNSLVAEMEKRVANPAVKDQVVKVVRGRRAVGTIGRVVVIMERPYNMGWQSTFNDLERLYA